jgi:predicted transglutaminase-like cysteine proteinase
MNKVEIKPASIFQTIFTLLAASLVAGCTAGVAQASPEHDMWSDAGETEIRFLGGIALPGSFAMPATEVDGPKQVAEIEHLFGNAQEAIAFEPEIDTMATGSITEGVFGSVAISMRSFPVTKRWHRIMHGIEVCNADKACAGRSNILAEVSNRVADKPLLEKMAIVNATVNTMLRYRSDKSTYGRLDYWATPQEILARGTGDCEDFAILKMTSLIRAGVPARSLSLVVLRDNGRGVFHAVLALSTSSGSYILDNTLENVPLDGDLSDYQPLYSLSTDRAWIHGSRSPSKNVAGVADDFSSIAPGEGFNGPDETPTPSPLAASLRQGLEWNGL